MRALENELKRVMQSICGERTEVITAEQIVIAACEALEVDRATIESPTKMRAATECRSIIAHLMRFHLHFKKNQIRPYLGNRDRSTVFHSLQVYDDLKATSADFRKKIELVNIKLEEICG